MQAKKPGEFMLYPYRLARFKGLTPNEKLIWAYIQSFGVFYATDKHVANTLGLSTSTVRHALVKFRRICGTKGRNFPKSDVPIHAHNVPKQAQDVPIHANDTPVLPMKTENRLNNSLDNKENSLLNRGDVPNQAHAENVEPASPPEQPSKPPPEIRPPQPTYDPYDVPFGAPVFERKEMSFEAFCENEDLKAKSQPWKRINP